MPFTAAQQAERLTGVGASEVPAIVGVSPYRTAMDVYLEKRGLVPPFEGNTATRWGVKLEGVIRDAYMEQMEEAGESLALVPGFDGTMTVRKPGTVYFASPDAVVCAAGAYDPETRRGVECKSRYERSAHLWGEPGTDRVPDDIAVQCQWSMFVTGLSRWDVAVLLGNKDFRIYTLMADAEVHAYLEGLVAEFWRQTEAGIPPTLDASEGTTRFLKAVYGTQADRDLLPATPVQEAVAETLATARAMEAAAVEAKVTAENILKDAIGVHGGLEGASFKATWNQAKPTVKIDYEEVVQRLADELPSDMLFTLTRVVRECTSIVPGSRRFLFTSKGA